MSFNKDQSLSRREMLKIGAGLLAGGALPDASPAQMLPPLARTAAQAGVNHLYIANDDQTDYFWAATADEYDQILPSTLDYYLNMADANIAANKPFMHQSKFNCDGHFWLWTYKQKRDSAAFDRLISRIRSGHISVPLNALCLCLGGASAETVLRGMYYAGQIERQYNLRFTLVYIVENQTLPYGIGALWAGAGAKYSWRGICGCSSRINFNATLTHDQEIYWWQGPDGSRILMKWYSYDYLKKLGGYSEAYDPNQAVTDLENKVNTTPYPYNIAGAFGYGWDHPQRLTNAFVTTAEARTTSTSQVYVSNELDFFTEFEQKYGANLPTISESYGNEWELYNASMAEVSAIVKRAVEQLRGAEAIATLVGLKNGAFMDGRQSQRDLAWMNLGLFYEHNWTANSDTISRDTRAAWLRQTANQIAGYVNTLQTDAVEAFGGMIAKSGNRTRFFAFNPLSWARTDYVDFPYPAPNSTSVHVVDLSNNQNVPSQIVTIDGIRYLRAWAEDVPAVGYKVFEIQGNLVSFDGAPTANAGTGIIENIIYQITMNSRGTITSLIDKTRANRQFLRTIGGKNINDLLVNNATGTGSGTISVQNAGPVSITLTTTAASPRNHTSSITLFRNSSRIDIRNRINENFGTDYLQWAFSFELTSPDTWHEEVGAIMQARLKSNGGFYAVKNARYDGLTLNHFADMTGTGSVGITLSTPDLQYMKLGNSNPNSLDTVIPQITVMAGGQIDGANYGIPNQGGDTQFLQRFGLQTHGAYDQVGAMKFGLEYQNPLVAGLVTGGTQYPGTQFSLITATNPNVLLWALKPAEDGMTAGLITRWWNVASSSQNLSFSIPNTPITSGRRVTHIETDIGAATVSGAALTASLTAQKMVTYLLKTSAGGAPPGVPILVAPLDGAQTLGGQPVLSWNAAANAARYELQLKSGSAPGSGDPVISLTALNYTPPTPLLVGQSYFWRVRAANSSSALSEWSETRDFIVVSTANAAPTRNYYRVKRPTLRWLPVSWAVGYEVQIATNNIFTAGLITNGPSPLPAGDDSYTPTTDLSNGTWYWRVRALKTLTPPSGNWSAAEQFMVDVP